MTDKLTVTKKQFQQYENIRELGICNMLSAEVREMTGFSMEVHRAIISQYKELLEKYPGVRKE
jgi:hypothetical protein